MIKFSGDPSYIFGRFNIVMGHLGPGFIWNRVHLTLLSRWTVVLRRLTEKLLRLDKLNPNLGSWFISNVLFNLL